MMNTGQNGPAAGAFESPAAGAGISEVVRGLVHSIALEINLHDLKDVPRARDLAVQIARVTDEGLKFIFNNTMLMPKWWPPRRCYCRCWCVPNLHVRPELEVHPDPWPPVGPWPPGPPPEPIDRAEFVAELAYVVETMQQGRLRDAVHKVLAQAIQVLAA